MTFSMQRSATLQTINYWIVNSLGRLLQAAGERYASVALAEEQEVRHLIDGGAGGVLGNEQRLAGGEKREDSRSVDPKRWFGNAINGEIRVAV